MTDFAALLNALGRHQVAYIVVGGAAAIAHGSARLTQDLDIVYERSPQNLDRLVAALADLKPYLRGAPPGLPFIWDRATLINSRKTEPGSRPDRGRLSRASRAATGPLRGARGLNFTLVTSLGDIDLLGEIPGGGAYPQLAGGAVELKVFETRCLCLSLPQLIRAKRAAGRPRDLEALAELEALEEEGSG